MQTTNQAAVLGFATAIRDSDRDVALAVCHPDIEFVSMLGISGRSYMGHSGIREYFDDIESAWAEWSVDVERVAEGADGRVAIVMTMRATWEGKRYRARRADRAHLDGA
jgi:ketosteroid isomerase-like protein